MANFKCKMCGAQLEVKEGQTVAVCSFCGSKQTVANANDERKENLFNRANALRLNCEFDKAILSYQSILSIFPNEPEAHWGLCLCKYGIEYVDDPSTKTKKPTIHRVSYDSILKDSDYLAALANADVIAKEEYQAEANEIANIQKNILSISQKEEPFDIFICYKESDENGKRTPDSVMAYEIYNQLTEKGYKVFFSRVTLESKLGTMYEPYIFAALNSAKIMLVIGTRKEYFDAVWVKNEWSRFIDLMKTRPDHYLIPCYKDMDAYEMPEQFLSFQAQDLSKLGFMQDLIRGIDKIMGKDNASPKVETKIIQTDVNVNALLKRAEILIGDANYEKADSLLERVLDNDPTNSQAYLLKLVIELQLKSVNALKDQKETLERFSNFQKAYDFADEEQKKKLNAINEHINNRNEEARLGRLYDIAMDYKNNKQYGEAEKAFSNIAGYKDATKQAAECVNLGKEDIYKRAVVHKENKEYDEAIETFNKVIDFSDSKDQVEECKELKNADLYKKALSLKEKGSFDEASSIFMQILTYNDSDFQVDECARLKTEAQKEAVYKGCLFDKEINPFFDAPKLKKAVESLATIPGYKDADQLLVKYEGILKDYEVELAKKKEEKKRIFAKKKKKAKKISIIAGSIAAVFTGVMLLIFLFLIPENRQGRIQNSIDQGNYQEAHSLIEQNGTYGDTSNLLSMCQAGEAFESLDYESGINYIYNIGGTVDVVYDSNGGSTTKKNRETIKKKASYINNESEKDGYTFYGWKQTSYSITSKDHYATVNLQAQYETITYTIKFVLNGGTCSSKLPSKYNTEQSIAFPNPTRTGYTFTGWSGSNGSTPTVDYTLPAGSIGNKTYKANWKANQYTIHLDANGGYVASETITATYDAKYSLPTPTPTQSGYDFLGWYDSSNRQVTDGTYKYTNDIYLTAKWNAIVYTINYDLDGGTNNGQNPSTYYVTNYFTLKNPTKTGYTFVGWTSSSVNEPTIGLEISKGTVGDLSFKAHWVANNYVITVDLDGGQMDSTSFDVTYDSAYQLTEPTRAGYDFVCYLDENNNEFPSSGTYTIAGNTSLTAKWKEREDTLYKVNYYLEDLDGENYTLDFTDNRYGVSDKEVTVAAKDYVGFTPTEVSKTASIKADGTQVINFYYTRNSYTLTFVTNGGTTVEAKTLKYEEAIPADVVASRAGYTFGGWYQEAGQINEFEKMPAENTTAYAYYNEETKASYFDVSYSNGKTTIVKANGLNGEVVIPLYIDDKPVCAIGDNAFYGLNGITSIKLPETVNKLGSYAFKDCTGLEKIIGTSNITTIEEGTFENCRVLSTFPDLSNVKSIGKNAFKNCASLTTIKISNTITSIGERAFSGCVSLLETPDLSGVTSIGDYAFEGCTMLTEIKSIEGCATFGEGIFTGCANIAKLTIQFRESVEEFYLGSFFGDSEWIWENLMWYDHFYIIGVPHTGSTNHHVPKTLSEIVYCGTGDIPFGLLWCMKSVTSFSDTSSASGKIGDYAFFRCSSLTSFSMVNPSVTEIGSHSFQGCASLHETPDLSSVTSIGDYAFAECKLITEVTIAGSIGSHAFYNDSCLTDLTINEGCKSIGSFAFADCTTLNKINSSTIGEANFPNFLKTIESYAFWNCDSLTNVSLGSSTSLSADSFKGCSNITKLSLSVNGDGWSSGSSFASAFPDSVINITEITVLEGTKIPDGLFQGMTYVESITLPDTITSIGANAFRGCTSLKRINSNVDGTFNLSNGLKTIGDSAFNGCTGLINANLGTSLLTIGTSAFKGCSNLVNAQLGDKVTSVGTYAFRNCSNIKRINSDVDGTINIPDSVTTIEDGVFYQCSNLISVKLPFIGRSIKQGSVAYQNCFGYIFGYTTSSSSDEISGYIYSGNITSTIYYHYAVPASLKNVTVTIQTVIPDKAFYNCSMLSNIVLPNSVTSEGTSAYYNCSAKISKTYVPTKSSPWDGVTIATSFHSGNGTEEDPYVIFDGNELAYLAQNVNNGYSYEGKFFILNNQIDMNSKAFVTIGKDAEHPFLGTINGHGYKISNFTISGSKSTKYVGLFGYFGGTLEHIGFSNGTITSDVYGMDEYYAGLVAYMTSAGSISNVYNYCKVSISGAYYVYAGGIVGYLDGGSITNSYNGQAIVANYSGVFAYAGGIAGYANSGTISGCLSKGDVTAVGYNLSHSKNGQIVGDKASSNVSIENCYKYSDAVLTRYSEEGSAYNADGTSGTASECMNALRTVWDSTKWNMTEIWPILLNL